MSFNLKPINPTQTYPQITESFACILWIIAMLFLFPFDFLGFLECVEFESCQSMFLFSQLTYKAIQWVSIDF